MDMGMGRETRVGAKRSCHPLCLFAFLFFFSPPSFVLFLRAAIRILTDLIGLFVFFFVS